MNRLLLLALSATMSLGMCAQSPGYSRSTQGPAKQINTAGHALTATAAATPFLAPAKEAPANAQEVPVSHSLCKPDKEALEPLYTIIDGNSDGKGWTFAGLSTGTVCLSSSSVTDVTDDWLVTPPIHLLPGVTYSLAYDEGYGLNSSSGNHHAVMMGTAPQADALTTEIVPNHSSGEKAMTTRETTFTVDAEGYYYFGFHATLAKGQETLKLANLKIEQAGDNVYPPAAGTLSYTLAPRGELKATVTYVAPTLNTNGEPLEAISKVDLIVNWGLKTETITDVAPGQTITVTVDGLWNNSNNKLEAIAYAGETAGESVAITNFWAGPDTPLPPTSPVVALSDDFTQVTLSWTPVDTIGEHGGWVDPDNVTYYVFDAFGSYYDPAIGETTQSTITFDYSDWTEQDFIAYQITAGNGELYSTDVTSAIVVPGPAEALPFGESFANAKYDQIWAVDPASTYNGWMVGTVTDNYLQTNEDDENPTYLNSQDGDNGFFYALPMSKDAVYGLQSGKVVIAGASSPVLEFWAQGMGSNVDVMVARDEADFEVARTIEFKQQPTSGWTLYRQPLDAYKDARYVRIALRYTAVDNDDDHTWSIPLDNIRVRDLAGTDLRLFAFAAPQQVAMGQGATLEARIENMGDEPVAGAQAVVTVGGEVVETIGIETLPANGFAAVTATVPTSAASPQQLDVVMTVVSSLDTEPTNNSAQALIDVLMPNYPTVTDLTGTSMGPEVSLEWNAPDLTGDNSPVAVTEDFENPSYTPLTITDFGGWKMVDADKGTTYTFMRDEDNPYRTQPMAYQLYNPVLAGVPESYMADVPTHSGSQMLVAWSTNGLNDNWLISPELSGNEQTISFYAKSFTIAYAESLEVLYSTTGTDTESFTLAQSQASVPEDWTEYTVTLPAGAKHFAIRHTANDTYALMLDDISFEAAPALPADLAVEGYNLYRNGVLVNDTPIASTSTTDMPLDSDTADGTYEVSYQVSVVYNHGESAACEPVVVPVLVTGLADIDAAQGTATYYNMQGMRVPASALTPGIYVRQANGKAQKVLVK